MSKILNGFPPERTALDRERSVAARPRTCCAVFLRELSKTIESRPRLSTRHSRLLVDCAGSPKEASLHWVPPEVKRFTSFRAMDSRPLPRTAPNSQTSSARQHRAGRPDRPSGAFWDKHNRSSEDSVCNGLFGMATQPCRTTRFAYSHRRISEPAAKPLACFRRFLEYHRLLSIATPCALDRPF